MRAAPFLLRKPLMVTLTQLIAAGVPPTAARVFLGPLNTTFDRFNISTPERQAAFLAQALHESKSFSELEENLYYTSATRVLAVFPSRVPNLDAALLLVRDPEALANRVYADRLGNGDEASGDGWRYRGRGIFQLTGEENYLRAMLSLDRDYLMHPELVAQPEDATLTAGWYWDSNDLNTWADLKQIDRITKAINGPAMLGARERRDGFYEALVGLA
jgi:putative chitinase